MLSAINLYAGRIVLLHASAILAKLLKLHKKLKIMSTVATSHQWQGKAQAYIELAQHFILCSFPHVAKLMVLVLEVHSQLSVSLWITERGN